MIITAIILVAVDERLTILISLIAFPSVYLLILYTLCVSINSIISNIYCLMFSSAIILISDRTVTGPPENSTLKARQYSEATASKEYVSSGAYSVSKFERKFGGAQLSQFHLAVIELHTNSRHPHSLYLRAL